MIAKGRVLTRPRSALVGSLLILQVQLEYQSSILFEIESRAFDEDAHSPGLPFRDCGGRAGVHAGRGAAVE